MGLAGTRHKKSELTTTRQLILLYFSIKPSAKSTEKATITVPAY